MSDELAITPKLVPVTVGVQIEGSTIVIDRSMFPIEKYPQVSHADILREVANMMDKQQGIIVPARAN
jgi:hypothetical protein